MKFLVGLAIGFAGAILFAPAPGQETRQRLIEKSRDWRRVPEKKAEEMAEAAEHKAGDIGAEIGRRAAESALEAVKGNVLGQNKTA
ncbi:MAG: YtxH domain-containing protein [Acidobacteriaceae bacterium]|nr:YtxH domain-containing protein [Acidobacteriaceae bacterium]